MMSADDEYEKYVKMQNTILKAIIYGLAQKLSLLNPTTHFVTKGPVFRVLLSYHKSKSISRVLL